MEQRAAIAPDAAMSYILCRCGSYPRHAIEFRHPSWFEVTTDFVYVRLHGHELTCASNYTEPDLRAWARR